MKINNTAYQQASTEFHRINPAQWIWAGKETTAINQYAEFRRDFFLDKLPSEPGMLQISADKDYVLWLNGCYIACGQFSDYPDEKTYDCLDLASHLVIGQNVLCVLVYCDGEDSATYRKGPAGLWFRLDLAEMKLASDEKTLSRLSSTYRSGSMPRLTGQLSFTYEYDAGAEDNWLQPEYLATGSWQPSTTYERIFNGKETVISHRPVPKLTMKESVPARIVAQGVFVRMKQNGYSTARLMQTDYLSPLIFSALFSGSDSYSLPSAQGCRLSDQSDKKADGVYLVIDLGREEAGYFTLDLAACAGTIVEIGYGQHLDDMRVRSYVGGRNFANRYICKEGRQHFTHYTTRLGGRYIQLHISNIRDVFVLYDASIKPAEYPVTIKGAFSSPNALWNKIYEVGIRTLHLCMHEHYEDTPWREQALYSMDSRNQALCGYYCFGDYDFAAASFDLLGKGLEQDGYLELCAPARVPITIPSFSMAWILELADHMLYSGATDLVQRSLPLVKAMLDAYTANQKEGLLLSPRGSRYWHFYEWAEGLDGRLGSHTLDTDRWDAPLNAFFAMVLEAAARMFQTAGMDELARGYAGNAETVKQAINERFWDEGEQVFQTYSGLDQPGHYAELTQALILCAGACPAERAALLRKRLAEPDHKMVETTLSHSYYKFEALLQDPGCYASFVFQKIEQDWSYMLYHGATSFWETIKGSADFAGGGSLCHGWSAIPVYFYQAYILGIKPLEPGFRSFKLDPVVSVIDKASGRVPTPYGDLIVQWEHNNGQVSGRVTHPAVTRCLPSDVFKSGALEFRKNK